jgi:hypothetical protein
MGRALLHSPECPFLTGRSNITQSALSGTGFGAMTRQGPSSPPSNRNSKICSSVVSQSNIEAKCLNVRTPTYRCPARHSDAAGRFVTRLSEQEPA